MWLFYVLVSLMTAGFVLKMLHPLFGRGKWRRGAAPTRADRAMACALVAVLPLETLAR